MFEKPIRKNSKIDNYVNKQKSKTSKSNLSKSWKETSYNMLGIMTQTSLFLILNIITKRVVTRISNLNHFGSGNKFVKFKKIKKAFGYLKMMSAYTHHILKL